MRTFFIIIFLATFIITSCNRHDCPGGTPQCIKNKISAFEKDACTDGKVEEYKFQGETVYVFDPGLCGADFTSEVTDEDCVTLGFLGGITGNTQINGEDFSRAKFKRKIWSK